MPGHVFLDIKCPQLELHGHFFLIGPSRTTYRTVPTLPTPRRYSWVSPSCKPKGRSGLRAQLWCEPLLLIPGGGGGKSVV